MNDQEQAQTTLQAPPLSKTPQITPAFIFGGGGAIVIVLCATCFCSQEDMYNAGWIVGYYGSIGLWLGAGWLFLVAIAATSPLTVGRAAVKFKTLLTLPQPKQMELPALSIGQDILIRFDTPEETPEQFELKVARALHIKGREVYVFTFPRYTSACVITRSADTFGNCTEEDATRSTLPWIKPDEWQSAHSIPTESWEEYEADLERAVAGFNVWVQIDKMKHAAQGRKALALAASMKQTAQILLFVFCALPALAQKSAQVAEYVGAEKFNSVKVNGEVSFEFEKLTLVRAAKGRTLAQVLPDARTYTDEDNAGQLRKITINGRLLPRIQPAADLPDLEKATRAEINKFMRPNQRTAEASVSTDSTGRGSAAWLDSVKIANGLNHAKDEFTNHKNEVWGKFVRPVWAFIMWIFTSLFAILLCFAGLCRYVAKTASTESLVNARSGRVIVGPWIVYAHQNAAAMMLVVMWIIGIVLLIDAFMWLVYLGLSLWLLVGCWFPMLWLAERLTSWLVPNLQTNNEKGMRPA